MIMGRVTFGAWLDQQVTRPGDDPVGEVARYWAGQKASYPKVRSIVSIQRVFADQGLLHTGHPMAAAWAQTVSAFGQQAGDSPVAAVPGPQEPAAAGLEMQEDGTPTEPGSYTTGNSAAPLPPGQYPATIQATFQSTPPGEDVLVQLRLVNARLTWLYRALASEPGTDPGPWPSLDEPAMEPGEALTAAGQPFDWEALHDAADFEADEEAL
jgi:hypothetical protein